MSRRTIALMVLVAVGLGLLLYPGASNWFAERVQSSELTGYAHAVAALPGPAKDQMLAEAEAYNARLAAGTTGASDATYGEYRSQLSPQPGDVMAELTVPSLRLTLPIYHGTSDDVLLRGVGHLFGTALPVGGVGTHAVLSAHSGLVTAELFTHLENLKPGDFFSLDVVGRRLVYAVDHIARIHPDDDSQLQPDPTQDYVTLLTCTPTGVNSHRLLVRGHRVMPVEQEQEDQVIAGRRVDPGFPWWAVEWAGGVAVAAAVGVLRDRRRSRGLAASAAEQVPAMRGRHHA